MEGGRSVVNNCEYVKIAEVMFGGHLPANLLVRLDEIDRLCRVAGGRLVSRQIIAQVIEQEERENGGGRG